MKKLLSLTLSVILLLNLFVVGILPIHANTTDTLDDHLVVHYDFKGETVAEALKDKATAGSVADDLDAYTPTNKNADSNSDGVPDGTPDAVDSENFKNSFLVDAEKGTVTNLLASASLQAPGSADTQKLFGTATWFFRFKIDDVSGGESWLLDMRYNAKARRMLSISVGNDGTVRSQAARTKDKFNTLTYGAAGTIGSDVYVNFALVMQQGDGSSGYNPDMIFTPYYAIGTPTSEEDWIALTATAAVGFRTDGLAINPLCLFNRWDGAEVTGNTGITLDDVRLYDKCMTKAEIAEMFADGVAANAFDLGVAAQESAIEMDAYQTRDIAGENAFDARFVASVDQAAIENAESITFEVSATYAGSSVPMRTLTTQYIYEKIWNGTEYAAHPDGDYYAMFTILGIDNETTVTFTVTPVINYTNGSSARGETKTVTFPTQA